MEGFHDNKWFVYVNDHHEGPFSMADLQSKLASGEVRREQYVWAEGMPDWLMMTAVRELDALLAGTAPSEAPPPTTPENIIDLTLHERPGAETSSEAEETPEKETIFKKIQTRHLAAFGVLLFFGVLSGGYVAGWFDPLLGRPGVASAVNATSGTLRGLISSIAAKIPVARNWVSPIPDFPGVEPIEYESLRQNALNADRPHLALAVDRSAPGTTSFRVTAAVPNGTEIRLILIGNPATLLGQTSLVQSATTEFKNHLASFVGIRQRDGRPIAQGEYRVFVMNTSNQPPAAQAVLDQLAPVQETLPPEAGEVSNLKLFAKRRYFLGGSRDTAYLDRLREFQARISAKSREELRELDALLEKLQLRLGATNERYSALASAPGARIVAARWTQLHEEWTKEQLALNATLAGWTDAIATKAFYHWGLFLLAKNAAQKIDELHTGQHALHQARLKDRKTLEGQVSASQAAAEAALGEFSQRLNETHALAQTGEGLPTRLSFLENGSLAPVPVDDGGSPALLAAPADTPRVAPGEDLPASQGGNGEETEEETGSGGT